MTLTVKIDPEASERLNGEELGATSEHLLCAHELVEEPPFLRFAYARGLKDQDMGKDLDLQRTENGGILVMKSQAINGNKLLESTRSNRDLINMLRWTPLNCTSVTTLTTPQGQHILDFRIELSSAVINRESRPLFREFRSPERIIKLKIRQSEATRRAIETRYHQQIEASVCIDQERIERVLWAEDLVVDDYANFDDGFGEVVRTEKITNCDFVRATVVVKLTKKAQVLEHISLLDKLVDLRVKAGDSYVDCHRFYLAVQSPVLAAMLGGNFSESARNTVSVIISNFEFSSLLRINIFSRSLLVMNMKRAPSEAS